MFAVLDVIWKEDGKKSSEQNGKQKNKSENLSISLILKNYLII